MLTHPCNSLALRRLCLAALPIGALLLCPPAFGQTAPLPSPDQIQAMIARGQNAQAVQALNSVITAHPRDARAWYLLAVAYDAQHDEPDAGIALNMAARCAPGVLFADPQELAGLKTRIAAAQPDAAHAGRNTLLGGIGVVLLAVLLSFAPSRKVKRKPAGQVERAPPYGFGYPAETAPEPGANTPKNNVSHDDLSNTGWS